MKNGNLIVLRNMQLIFYYQRVRWDKLSELGYFFNVSGVYIQARLLILLV